ncbi:MAG: hypothetical protein IPN34_09240 [Planctomycetes bacterium]|nr:hypothetical protein [Planctomycetota bacterium]
MTGSFSGPLDRSSRAAQVLLALALLCCGPSCGVREMRVTTAEDAGEIWIDGHPMGHRDVRVATPRGLDTHLEWYRDGQRVGGRVVPLDSPLGYRFPFDYVFEALLPLPGSWRTEFRIEADPPPPPGGIDLGPYPEGAWGALWHQVRIEALRSRVLANALDRRAALRLEGPTLESGR